MTYPDNPPVRPVPPVTPQPVPPPPGYYAAPSSHPLPPPYPPPYLPLARAPRNGMGTAGMVLGIIGVVSTLASQSSRRSSFSDAATVFGYFLVPVTLGILAVVFGVNGRARVAKGEATNSGRATSGLVLGIVTLALCALFAVVALSRL